MTIDETVQNNRRPASQILSVRKELQWHYAAGCSMLAMLGTCVLTAYTQGARYAELDYVYADTSLAACIVAGMTMLAVSGGFALFWNDERKSLERKLHDAMNCANNARDAHQQYSAQEHATPA